MPSPTSIRLTLCKGALAKLLPHADWDEETTRPLAHQLASSLEHTLTERYEQARVEVDVRPDLFGRLRLVFDGPGVDGGVESERIWGIVEQVARWVYV
ncbi:MAG: hypothetical protein L0Y66_12290 [Myxococcaceae bacterium]|nr:hypothetical protein [Myxococcaceae bacterium]MCI0669616.1 hypothetical protein [Myxococcaceae bacterium]